MKNVIISAEVLEQLLGNNNNNTELRKALAEGQIDLSNINYVPATEGKTKLRLKPATGFNPKTHKACNRCFKAAKEAGKSQEEALTQATKPLKEFGVIKGQDGSTRPQSYCKDCMRKASFVYNVRKDPAQINDRLAALRERMHILEQEYTMSESSEQMPEVVETAKPTQPKARLVKKSQQVVRR